MRNDLSRADQAVRQGLRDGAYTAACLLAGQGDKVLMRRAYGRLGMDEDSPYATEQTLFDLDSLTKPLVIGMLALRAMEAGKLCLNDRLGTFINAPRDKADITIAQMLSHTAGFAPGLHLWHEADSADETAQVILAQPLASPPGEKVHSGCAGYILLGQLLECLYGMELSELALQEVFWPLHMQKTAFNPSFGSAAATEMQDDGRCLQGVVHDENARFLGGVSGNAGVFSTMDDLALWMQMLAANGALPDGSRYLCPATIRLMMRPHAPGRALGFALPGAAGGFTGDLFPPSTIGHTGFTGCSVALDPETGIYPPATLSKRLLTDLLKKELGFEGIIVSDATVMGGFCGYINYYEACARFLEAGGDCLLFVNDLDRVVKNLKRLVECGKLSLDTLRNRAYRMLCFAREISSEEYNNPEISREEAKAVSDEMVEKACTVIRDRKHLLPYKLTENTKILHLVCSNNYPPEYAEDLTNELKKITEHVDVYIDAGPKKNLALAEDGGYDLIVCTVGTNTKPGWNTARLHGAVARNMMDGWCKIGPPVIFVNFGHPHWDEEYMAADTVINTCGYTEHTASVVMKKIIGQQ